MRGRWAAGVLGLVTGVAGCGRDDGRVEVYPVHGSVKVRDEVPEGALVVLNPVDAAHGDLRPSGKVRGDGTFRVTTYDADDGAPAGDYVATITWNKVVKKGNDYAAGPNVVPPAFATREQSPWKVRVAAGPNEIPPQAISK